MSGIDAPMQANVRKIYFLNFCWMFLLIQAVAVPFFGSRGLNDFDIFIVQAIFSLTLCAFDVPCGYLADVAGPRRILLLASLLKGVGGVALIFAHGVVQLGLVYALLGVANSLYSGADIALLYDSASALDGSKRQTGSRMLSTRTIFMQAGALAAAPAGAWIAERSFVAAIVLNGLFAWAPLFVALALRAPPRSGGELPKLRRFRLRVLVSRLLGRSPGVGGLMRLSIAFAVLPPLATLVVQGWWAEIGVSVGMFGPLTLAYQGAGLIAALAVPRIEEVLGSRGSVVMIGLLPIIGFLGMAFAPSAVALVLGAALEICRGFAQPICGAKLNTELTPALRATTNSIASMIARLVVGMVALLIGLVAQSSGYDAATAVLGTCYLVIFLFICMPVAGREEAGS